jgi:hypothetical protein
MHSYELRPRKDHRGVDLISDALPFGGLWYLEVAMQSATRSSTAAHMMPRFRVLLNRRDSLPSRRFFTVFLVFRLQPIFVT